MLGCVKAPCFVSEPEARLNKACLNEKIVIVMMTYPFIYQNHITSSLRIRRSGQMNRMLGNIWPISCIQDWWVTKKLNLDRQQRKRDDERDDLRNRSLPSNCFKPHLILMFVSDLKSTRRNSFVYYLLPHRTCCLPYLKRCLLPLLLTLLPAPS